MNSVSVDDVKEFLLKRLQATHAVSSLEDDLDLLESGLLDSLGVVELIGAVEGKYGVLIDFAELDADQLTIIGPFCRYVAARVPATERVPSKSAPSAPASVGRSLSWSASAHSRLDA